MKERFWMRCIDGNETYSANENIFTCPKHEPNEEYSDIIFEYDLDSIKLTQKILDSRQYNILRWSELLPLTDTSKFVTLGEGWTELNRARNLEKSLNLNFELYVKYEHGNPTGSFKDRGMSVGVTHALEIGVNSTGCASTGNTAASLAAYSAKAGLRCFVFAPNDVARGKIVQTAAYGAHIIGVKGNFDDAFSLLKKIRKHFDIYMLNSINPWRTEGQKTCGYEIATQLGYESPDKVIVPMGNCANNAAIWRGFKDMYELDIIDTLPQIIGVQVENAAPFYKLFKEGWDKKLVPLKPRETIASAIKIGNPVNWKIARKAIKESNGYVEVVSDKETKEAQKLLAEKEGLFVEPASATPIAALSKLWDKGIIKKEHRVVCIATGTGLKDQENIEIKIHPVKAEGEEIINLIQSLF